jgi:hypothetical protein
MSSLKPIKVRGYFRQNNITIPPQSEYKSIDDIMAGGEEQRCAGSTPQSLVNVHLTQKGMAFFIGLVRDKLRLKNSIINTQRLRIIALEQRIKELEN